MIYKLINFQKFKLYDNNKLSIIKTPLVRHQNQNRHHLYSINYLFYFSLALKHHYCLQSLHLQSPYPHHLDRNLNLYLIINSNSCHYYYHHQSFDHLHHLLHYQSLHQLLPYQPNHHHLRHIGFLIQNDVSYLHLINLHQCLHQLRNSFLFLLLQDQSHLH